MGDGREIDRVFDDDGDGEPTADARSGQNAAWVEERQLVAQIRNGDRTAFERVFLRYASPLADFGMAYVHSREAAEDLVHDLFLTLWRDRAAWQPKSTIEAYLFLALRNRAHNYLRHERIAEQWRMRSAREIAAESDEAGTEARLESAERQAIVVRAIAELPERARLVATLRWVDGLTYPEIAQRLGITVKGVEKAVARAFGLIQQRLGVKKNW